MLPTIAIIGAGTMGEALIKGLLRDAITEAQAIIATGPRAERCEELRARYQIRATQNNVEAAEEAKIVFLSVKPQVMPEVLVELRGHLQPEALVFSIAAGVALVTIQEHLEVDPIVRAMPNTPAQIGQGITVWTTTETVTEAQRGYALTILQAMGEQIYVKDEHYLDMSTALSGTGPAYIYLFMEALIDAGVHLGFSRRVAKQLVQQTIIGSALYARESGLHLAELRNQVTSPGGTTAEALYHIEKGGFRTVLSRAIWAAYVRASQLGRGEER
jgi:pyrroline-5-carboxylate reductase